MALHVSGHTQCAVHGQRRLRLPAHLQLGLLRLGVGRPVRLHVRASALHLVEHPGNEDVFSDSLVWVGEQEHITVRGS